MPEDSSSSVAVSKKPVEDDGGSNIGLMAVSTSAVDLPAVPEEQTVDMPPVEIIADERLANRPHLLHSRVQSMDASMHSLDLDAIDAAAAEKTLKKPSLGRSSSSTYSKGGKLPHIPAAANHDDDERYADRIRLGICAMDKKARSKPMAEILSRLDENLFQVVFFGDDLILNKPIEDWPDCDVLIAFFSKGYPLHKAKDYVELRKPFILNDLQTQALLQDRRRVYDLLEGSGIDVPRHVYLSRDGYVSTGTGDGNCSRDQDVREFDDHIEINGVSIHKPFVEKPVDAEDHNIAI